MTDPGEKRKFNLTDDPDLAAPPKFAPQRPPPLAFAVKISMVPPHLRRREGAPSPRLRAQP
jgi:hypothetical protein